MSEVSKSDVRMPPLFSHIHEYVGFHADYQPSKTFMWADYETHTFAEAKDQVDQIAKALIAMGFKKGERIAFFGNPTPAFFLHFLATASMGAIWQGLNPKYKEGELAYVIDDARPSVIFAQVSASGENRIEELSRLADNVGARVIELGEGGDLLKSLLQVCSQGSSVSDEQLAERRADVNTHDPAFIVYTSGSTGHPKGALLSHYGENFCNVIAAERKSLMNRQIICNLPINHVGAIGDICARTMVGGGTIYFQEKFDPVGMMKLIEEKRMNCWGAVPAVFQLSVSSPVFDEVDLSSVELIAWSGARMPADLLKTLQKKTGATEVTTGYGMTETTGGVTYSRLDDDPEVLADVIGIPDARQPIRLWHEEDRQVNPGEKGEIQVFGKFVLTGYWNRPDATEEAFTEDGWFKTGDVAVQRPDGNIEIVGRLSEMYKSGGYNVYPREIELALEERDEIALAAVVSVPDPTFQEVGHAYLMSAAGKEIDEAKVTDYLKDKLANYKVPKKLTVLPQLPMLPIGKVDKVTLKKMARGEA